MAPRKRNPIPDGSPGDRLRAAILDVFELSPAELAVLDQAVVIADELARINAEMASAEPLAVGSAGQPVAHPLLDAQRRHSDTLARLLDALHLPVGDEDEGEAAVVRKARAAANVRWARHRASKDAG